MPCSMWSIPSAGEYWVVKLGPIVDGFYQYSVVTDSKSSTLFILVSEPQGLGSG